MATEKNLAHIESLRNDLDALLSDASALVYMLNDPERFKTLPSAIKLQIKRVLGQINKVQEYMV